MAKLYFASLVTLSVLVSMVAGIILAVFVETGTLDVGVALVLVVLISTVMFVISPWLTDLTLRWVNRLEFLDDQAVAARYPHVHAMIHEVARDYRFKAPHIGIIPDRNPTAFTYGLLRSNARIVLTEGMFEFLNEEETRAVVAHELGHIVNRDFLVMTVAGVLVQILYVLYANLARRPSRGSAQRDKNNLVLVGLAAYVMYIIGTYILLYLSRTREYLADAFAAERVEARHLANALVKIAYGIAEVDDSDETRQLLGSTRHMGVVDFKGAQHLGLVAEAARVTPEATANSMLFDIYNPWARFVELASTHPLTGRRIQALGAIAKAKRQSFQDIDVDAAARRANVDKPALRRKFVRELAIVAVPTVAVGLTLLIAALTESYVTALLALPVGALAWLFLIPLTYPSAPPAATNVVTLMGDVAASPVVGRPVHLEGEVIGRAVAGSVIGEDTIFADRTGRMMVDFRSLFGPLGDVWTGWRRIAQHIGQKGEVTGWFRRGMGGHVIMRDLSTTAGRLKAYPQFAGVVVPLVIFAAVALVAGIVVFLQSLDG